MTEKARGAITDFAIVAAVMAIAAAQSWMRWLDPIVDTGRDLYIPEQLAHGVKLYRDILYFYPPLTPYLLAALTAVTGHSIAAYVFLGFVVAGATAALLYLIAFRIGNRIAAVTAAATFAACSVAGQSTWGCNYFFPYAHAAVFAMLFLLGVVAALLVNTRVPLVIAVVLAVAASWTKVEYAVFAPVVLLVAVIFGRVRWWILAAFAALDAVVFAFVGYVFRDTDWLHGNVIPDVMMHNEGLRMFYRSVAGFDRWPALLFESVAGAIAIVAIVLLLRHDRIGVATLLAAVIGLAGVFYRPWAVLQLVLIPFAVRRRNGPLAVLLAASVCASSRVILNLTPIWYGFVLIVPVYALAAYVLFALLPREAIYSERASRAWIAAFAGAALHSLVLAHGVYAKKTHPIETPRGTLYDVNADRAAILNELGKSGLTSLVVIPEGLALNYLFEVPTPITYYTFTPPEAADPRAEAAIIREIETKRPQWIAVLPRDMREFGSRGFGVDYDQQLRRVIEEQYAPARRWSRPAYSLLLLKKR